MTFMLYKNFWSTFVYIQYQKKGGKLTSNITRVLRIGFLNKIVTDPGLGGHSRAGGSHDWMGKNKTVVDRHK